MNYLELEVFTPEIIEEIINSNLEESINIEFKSVDALSKENSVKKEISKDVSAFANSDGGTIFYGINEKDHVASSYSFIDGTVFTKEWLENIIISTIQPKIDGLIISPIRFENDLKKTIYVVKIPQSNSAPHINGDKKYYRRFNFQSVPMEEYEIRNLYLRQRESKIDYHNIIIYLLNKQDNCYHFRLEIQVTNGGNYICEKYRVACYISYAYGCELYADKSDELNITQKNSGIYKFSTTKTISLFPNEFFNVLNFTIKIPENMFEEVIAKMQCKVILFNITGIEEIPINNLPELFTQIINEQKSLRK
jgi:hypothetical protein